MSSLKLELKTEAFEYLRPVLRETRTAEETAEAIIPDSCPDVAEILHTGGMAFLRGKELGEGTGTVSAGVSAMVMVQPEGAHTPELIEVYIPMTIRFEAPDLKPGMLSQAQVQLRRLDSHMVNPRKVLVRATVAAVLKVWESCEERHSVSSDSEDVQILTGTEPLKLMTCVGEKSYTLEDTVRLSPDGFGEKLMDYQIRIEHTESRLTGTRAIIKGNVLIDALYMTEDTSLQTGQAQLPFSQYIDLGDCDEMDELSLWTALAGADVELSSDGGGLNVTLQLMSGAEVWALREISYVQDLYSLCGQAENEMEIFSYESLLDQQCFSVVGRASLPGTDAQQAAYARCVLGEVRQTRSGEVTEFTMPVSVQILTVSSGQLRGDTLRVELTCSTRAAPGCRFEVWPESVTASASAGLDGLDVKVSGMLCVSAFGQSELQEIAGAEISETESERDGPGLIIRRPSSQETLWDIAKQYRTTIAAITKANHLSGDPGPDTLLLIPR